MVPPERIELSASPLPRECSTTELRRHGGAIEFARTLVGAVYKSLRRSAMANLCFFANRFIEDVQSDLTNKHNIP